MRRLYEWCVATGPDESARLSPVGLTDAEPRARARMLEALEAVPPGVPARGWVVAMLYLPLSCCYDRCETRVCAERTETGAVQIVAGSHD
jgi:hypothetical protein